MFTNLKRKLWLQVGWSEMTKLQGVLVFVRRWAPVLSVLGLTLKNYLNAAGNAEAAGFLGTALAVAGLCVSDPEMIATTAAFGGAAYKFGKLVASGVAAGQKP